MKLSNIGRRLVAAASTALAALTIVSCGASNTVDVVFVTSNKQSPGQINVYYLDSESGALHQLVDSPYPSGGVNPVYEVTSPNGLNLYVANHDDNTIVQFAIGTDGKLYPLNTVNTPGTEPVALAINPAGTQLYVLDYYSPAAPGEPSYTDLNPGPGSVSVFPINSDGSLGTPVSLGAANYLSVQCFPTNLAITPNGNFLYVTNTNAVVTTDAPPVSGTIPQLPASCPSSGTVSAFAVASAANGGGLTALTGSPFTTGSGSEPTGIVADPDSGALYVTDAALNQLYTFSIGSAGGLTLAATTDTGTEPMGAVAVSTASAKYLYVSNYIDGSLSSYSLSGAAPSPIATSTAGASGPLCMVIDPDLQRFLYTADYVGGLVGGAELDPATGGLIQNQGSPYVTEGQPTCVAAVAQKQGKKNGL
ncbi:MAG TPA: beta-propeller fold lactonase family protein [Acidobacteriaceae bacterium]|nr:beta-propeller fold lactonase family protein [Acidobacteriaceae bacterium]